MKHAGRPHWTVALGTAALTCSSFALAQAPVAPAQPEIAEWAGRVWNSARTGDRQTFSTLLDRLPAVAEGDDVYARLRRTIADHEQGQLSADQSRQEQRQEAIDEMTGHVEAGELVLALRSAIEVQDLGDGFDEVFENQQVQELIQWARTRLPEAETSSDWLEAQELLFLLRTLYEDAGDPDQYHAYSKHLDQVNRRVALLAQYAPRHLHDLRAKAAERHGEEPIEEYNPATAVDWRERLDGIDAPMLRGAMRIAAREHIETEGNHGWRVLMEGGLGALQILATTPGLEEIFPGLADEQLVQQWTRSLDREMASLKSTPDDDLDSWRMSRLVDNLLRANAQSVELPREVVYREFGEGAVYKFDELYDDPYSEIIWPDKVRRFQQQTEGNFIGVGILIRHDEKRQIMVVNPLEGTPAYFSGVKPNDLIIEVDGESAVGWSLNDAVDRITGPKGEEVILGIRREGVDDLIELPVVRDVIKLRTVKGWWKQGLDEQGDPQWDWYIDPVTKIAYVRLTQFTEDTYHDLRRAWMEITADGRPHGLILDLRYNPGGLLTSAVKISNLFVQDGLIVSGEDKHGQPAFPDQTADPRHAELFGVPTVVLINKGSASASEIVAGALQAHGAAVIVGERSYGKGSVQTVHLIADEARLKLTTHYYRLPPERGGFKGRLVHKRPGSDQWGVEPDIEVRMTTQQVVDSIELRQAADIIPQEEDVVADADADADAEAGAGAGERPDVADLLTRGLDPQVQTALLILQARAIGEVDENARHAGLR